MKLSSFKSTPSTESSGLKRVGGVRLGRKKTCKNPIIYKHKHYHMEEQLMEDDRNSEEINLYLNKLQEMVPWTPKNQRMSKVEVIDHVIDYIHQLRYALGLPPCPTSDKSVDVQLMESAILMLPDLVKTDSRDGSKHPKIVAFTNNVSTNNSCSNNDNSASNRSKTLCPISLNNRMSHLEDSKREL